MRWQDNRAAGLPFRRPGVKGTQELTMIDFARKKLAAKRSLKSV
jgi:hypothetical protein